MPFRKHKPEEIIGKLREAEIVLTQGASAAEAWADRGQRTDILWRKEYGGYGYRRVTALLRSAGWTVNRKRVELIWRREGLKVPQKQPKRGRSWLSDGSCIRLSPEYPGHVWAEPAYKVPTARSAVGRQAEGDDFVKGRPHDGRKFRILTIIDEASRYRKRKCPSRPHP